MSSLHWLRSTAGLLRVELRSTLPMATGLIATGALLLLAARYQFKMAPEIIDARRPYAWAVLTLAAMVPLAADLFGSSARTVRASTLRPLPARRSQVFAAKLSVFLVCAMMTWTFTAGTDLALDQFFPRTKMKPGQSMALSHLVLGTPVLALFVAALMAAIIRNALSSTLLGLVTLIFAGAAVVAYIAPPHSASSLEAWGLSAAYFALHPVVLTLTLGCLAWASALRGRASANHHVATLRRSLAGLFLCLAAPVLALGSTAVLTASADIATYDEKGSGVLRVVPSPDGNRLLVNVGNWRRSPGASTWIVDVDSGDVRQLITPREIAKKIPFGTAQVFGGSWSPDGESVGLDIMRALPWLEPSGSFDLRDGSFEPGSFDAWSYHELSRWHHIESDGYARAVARFEEVSCDEAIAALKALAPRYLHAPRRAPGVIFGFAAGDVPLRRIDGASGTVRSMDALPISEHCNYRIDPLGTWVVPFPTRERPNPSLVSGLTGEVVDVPEGWEASRSSLHDMIVRDDAIFVSRRRAGTKDYEVEWAWLRDGALDDVHPVVDSYEIIDLDGDRMVAVSRARRTLELLDRSGEIIRTLRAPAMEVE